MKPIEIKDYSEKIKIFHEHYKRANTERSPSALETHYNMTLLCREYAEIRQFLTDETIIKKMDDLISSMFVGSWDEPENVIDNETSI